MTSNEEFKFRLLLWMIEACGSDPVGFAMGLELGLALGLRHREWALRVSDFITNDRIASGEPEVCTTLAAHMVDTVGLP